jgi:hypothetical protein
MRFVTVDDLGRNAVAIVRGLTEAGSVIVTDDGKPAAVVLRLTEDEAEDYLLSRNESLKRELEEAYEECLQGVGRPAADLLAELPDDDG